jgi:AraC-like DNA-binding protein
MKKTIAGGIHYFEAAGFPLAIRRVSTDPEHTPSHPHDLTEVNHYHDFCELVLVTRGTAMHRLEESSFPVTAGDVFLLQGRQSHYFHDRKDLELINIMYDPGQIGLPEAELRKLPGYCAMFMLEPSYRRRHRFASRLHLQRIPLARAEQLADEMEKECAEKAAGYEAALRAKLIELIVYLARAYNFSEATEARALLRVGHVIGALENDFSRNWQLRDLQKTAGMSRSNLMRVFREATGVAPIEYLLRLRIQKAMKLLRGTSLSVTEVALRTGFNDSNYFTRQFRKIAGCPPAKYRKGTAR